MNTEQNMESRLWDYIDGLCTPTERDAIDNLLGNNPAWRRKYDELLDIHGLIKMSETDEPSMRFTKNVMEEVSKMQIAPSARSYVNKKIIYGILAFFLVTIVGFLIYGISQVNWSEGSSSQLPVKLPNMDLNWRQYFNNTYVNIFLMIDAVVGLMLLDRYLRRKKEKEQTTNG